MRGADVAQDRAVAAGEHRRPPAAGGADDAVTDRVDAAEQDMETAGLDAAVDLAVGEAGGDELAPRHDSALASGDLRDGAIRVDSTTHVVV